MSKHLPRKRFGQHFLTDQTILNRIVSAFAPKQDQLILEIGPGLGAVTEILLQRIDSLIAVELDRDLAERLNSRYSEKQLQVIQQDVLNFDFRSVLAPDQPDGKLRIIGNLPYNISTPLIFHLLQYTDIIEDMLFMLQKEVAQRLSAQPGNKHYGRLTVMSSVDLECQCLFDVPPQAFDPPPKVDSTILRLKPRSVPFPAVNREKLHKIVSAAFSQRRKTVRNALKTLISNEQFKQAGIDPGQRAENLTVQQYIDLSLIVGS